MNVLFYLRRSRSDKYGKMPVYLRLTVNGEKSTTDINTGVKIYPENWKDGRDKKDTANNLLLDTLEQKIKLVYATQVASGNIPTLKSILTAIDCKHRVDLFELAEMYFEYCEKYLVNNPRLDKEEQLTVSTVKTYRYKFKHIVSYYSSINKRPYADEINPVVLQNMTDWLRIEGHIVMQRSTIARVVTVLKKVLKWGYKKGHIATNPVKDFEYARGADKTPLNLTLDEVQKIWACPYPDELQATADLFIIQCYTGMEHEDIYRFLKNNVQDINGRKYIVYERKKNGNTATVPLFEPVALLMNKYSFNWPVLSKDLYNQLLKRVGDRAGIALNLTMRIGRKTFANLCKNYWGYSTTALAAMMGHKKEETQRHYSRPSGQSVVNEFLLKSTTIPFLPAKNILLE